MEFAAELRHLLNRCSKENGSDTPDFILAEYLESCLDAFDVAVRQRKKWYTGDEQPTAPEGAEDDNAG